ncbi:MAG: EscU/YscU/HrcU family type III secretion system export apparatus switch protein [Elusimicrobiales bacterium]|nr:EscU/YscU/HrcU family type III secretion system export apparatus switch protein [Elusimicrobiales bacterium]
MSFQEKTEKPTGKRLSELRKRGDVLRSYDFSVSLAFFLSFYLFFLISKYPTNYIKESFRYFFSFSYIDLDLNILINNILKIFLFSFLPIGLGIVLVSMISFLIPSGIVLTKPKISFERFNPLKNIKDLFSLSKLFEVIKNILKVFFIFFLIYHILIEKISSSFNLLNGSFYKNLIFLNQNIKEITLKLLIILFGFSFLDLVYQFYVYNKRIKMTKQEVKEEYKEMEGNPLVKGKIRRMMREFTKRNKISQVKESSVVITNPTHFAVALRYKPPFDKTPVLVAKGKDKLALKIIDIAYKNGIPVKREPPLARAIYKMCDVGEEINPIFYKAVAVLIAKIYKERKRI